MEQRDLPLSMVTLVFVILGIPLAFARQLCVPALIMALLAIAFHLWGRRKQKGGSFSAGSVKRSSIGFKLAVVGAVCSLAMWILWATNALF